MIALSNPGVLYGLEDLRVLSLTVKMLCSASPDMPCIEFRMLPIKLCYVTLTLCCLCYAALLSGCNLTSTIEKACDKRQQVHRLPMQTNQV
jgi:hypothetical protein